VEIARYAGYLVERIQKLSFSVICACASVKTAYNAPHADGVLRNAESWVSLKVKNSR